MCDSTISKIELETGSTLTPRFDEKGLVTAVVSEAGTNQPLMVAHMNAEALRLTIETGEAHFWSRSRQEIWHKGGTSGNVLKIAEIHIDCDQDCLWVSATSMGHGAVCHTGRKSCFYRKVITKDGEKFLEMTGAEPLFDPKDVYK